MEGADPVGTLECPDGWVLDEALNMCVPGSALDVAGSIGDNFVRPEDMPAHLRPKKPKKKVTAAEADKMERCITSVKAQIRKSGKTFKDQSVKSAAIAICRSRLKK